MTSYSGANPSPPDGGQRPEADGGHGDGSSSSSSSSKLAPDDARVRHSSAEIRGKTYTYVVGEPPRGPVRATAVLLHGFPDLGFGWRCQVPYLTGLGLRVVVPDMLGYAGTSRPDDLALFSLKNVAADVAALARLFVGDGQVIVGGHDWGGVVAWRLALWHPDLVRAVFSVCTPFMPPRAEFVPLHAAIAAGRLTNFRYQLQLRGPEVEDRIQGEVEVRQFLAAVHDGFATGQQRGFTVDRGVIFDHLPGLGNAGSLAADELDHYVRQFMLQPAPPLRGPLNWYRTQKINFDDELPLAQRPVTLQMPALFIGATNDPALPQSMSAGMERSIPRLTRGEVSSSHWALTEASAAVNEQLGAWIRGVLSE